jgi:glycosyltransferase involved in cell wall biosynthesis
VKRLYDIRSESSAASDLRVLILTEHLNATYFISFHFAMQRLCEERQLSFAVMSESRVAEHGTNFNALAITVFDEFRPSLVVFTRYAHPSGIAFCERAKIAGVPTVYHIDDDLLNLPSDLGHEVLQRHSNPTVIRTRHTLLSSVNLIYASTRFLHDQLQTRFPDSKVLSGMYAPYMEQPSMKRKPKSSEFTIGYMGSKGHGQDLALIADAIGEILAARPDVHFETFGTVAMPSQLQRFGNRVRSRKTLVDYASFLRVLCDLPWNLGLAPLNQSVFNRCKAPTKFIEYTACGIPTMASNISVYRDVIGEDRGVLVSDDGWLNAMSDAAEGTLELDRMVDAARSWCATEFSLPRLQRQLLEVFSLALGSRQLRPYTPATRASP